MSEMTKRKSISRSSKMSKIIVVKNLLNDPDIQDPIDPTIVKDLGLLSNFPNSYPNCKARQYLDALLYRIFLALYDIEFETNDSIDFDPISALNDFHNANSRSFYALACKLP